MSEDRSRQLQAVAHNIGMRFEEEDPWGFDRLLSEFQLFKRGRHRKYFHLMRSQDDLMETDVRIFDYHFVTGSSNSRKTHLQTVFFIQSKKLGLPHFLMKPERFFHRLGTYLGMQDIDFEAFPKFSDQYLLQGKDEDYIRASFKNEVLHFFSLQKGWSLEGLNYYLIFYKKDQLLLPSTIADFYKKGMTLHRMLQTRLPDIEL
ncbi:MAG TPA: hypothetical protein PKA00_01955 [Saprospiraceae bacterium]|nr:hypothetical protein [Saprospiraceae bacterium]HMQ81635.1 hypothetical protein [Saprospiraceae bacterium]